MVDLGLHSVRSAASHPQPVLARETACGLRVRAVSRQETEASHPQWEVVRLVHLLIGPRASNWAYPSVPLERRSETCDRLAIVFFAILDELFRIPCAFPSIRSIALGRMRELEIAAFLL